MSAVFLEVTAPSVHFWENAKHPSLSAALSSRSGATHDSTPLSSQPAHNRARASGRRRASAVRQTRRQARSGVTTGRPCVRAARRVRRGRQARSGVQTHPPRPLRFVTQNTGDVPKGQRPVTSAASPGHSRANRSFALLRVRHREECEDCQHHLVPPPRFTGRRRQCE